MKPYELSLSALESLYSTHIKTGLTFIEATKRYEQDGANLLPKEHPDSLFLLFIRQFKEPLLYILLIAAIIIFLTGNHQDALIISCVLFFNAIIGTVQEGRAQRILNALTSLSSSQTVVIRDGKHHVIDDTLLVVGDIIALQEGQKVPADARIVEEHSLSVNEALLTGESMPIKKTTDTLQGTWPLFDQHNMLFKGTTIAQGNALALVVATGIKTEIGSIHTTISQLHTETPLKKTLDRLSHGIIITLLGFCSVLFIIGLLLGKTFSELLTILTALFICAVPEGLPIVFTLVLVAGVQRMAKRNVLVKKMQAVEGLGSTDVIIIDKTGTLTRNEMMVHTVATDHTFFHVTGSGYDKQGAVTHNDHPIDAEAHKKLFTLATACALLDTSQIEYAHNVTIKGDPTEAAMGIFAYKLGAEKEALKKIYHQCYEQPFSSETRQHSAVYEKDGHYHVFIAGVPEVVMRISTSSGDFYKKALEAILVQGLRTIALAHYVTHEKITPEEALAQSQGAASLLGILGLQDSIRPEVKAALQHARAQDICVVMATGDHATTATYIAQNTGIITHHEEVIEGAAFQQLSHKEQLDALPHIKVFARVTPADKLALVKLYQGQGKIVAMTGDGVNDVPSIVAANVGIAMGKTGTDIAKEAADIILLDDSFGNIVAAIEEGKHIFQTLKRVVMYFFATNLSEVFIISFSLLGNWPMPLLAPHILWLNLVTDGFLDVSLSQEPKETTAQEVAHAGKNKQSLITKSMVMRMVYQALIMTIGSLFVFYWYRHETITKAQTATLTCMAMFQWLNAWNCRSQARSLFSLPLLSNISLVAATLLVVLLHLGLLYLNFMQKLFYTTTLTTHDWLCITPIALTIVVFEELRKLYHRRLTGYHKRSSL